MEKTEGMEETEDGCEKEAKGRNYISGVDVWSTCGGAAAGHICGRGQMKKRKTATRLYT